MKKIILSSICLFFITLTAYSQSAVFDWAKRMGGAGYDGANAVAVDGSGNVYTAGIFNGTANFNPGGTYNLTSTGGYDVFISKLDAAGNFVSAFRFGGPSSDEPKAIAVDAAGDVYVAGYFSGTADFDPSAAAFSLTAGGTNDIFVARYTSAGTLVWAKRFGAGGPDVAYGLTIDATSNVYVTGYFYNSVDFDPGPSIQNLNSAGGADIFVLKLSSGGNYLMAKRMGGILDDIGSAITVDASLNIYSTGKFEDISDFDPGAGTANLTCNGIDNIYISKLDASGNYAWAKRMGTKNVDAGGIVLDASSNVYATGRFDSIADFGSTTLTSAGNIDAYVTKLDALGNFTWAKNMGGTLSDAGNSISLDASANVYTTGHFTGTADFDPSASSSTLTAAGSADCFISKLTNAGAFVWAKQLGGASGFDSGLGIKVISTGHIYTVGGFDGTSNFNAPGTYNLTSAGSGDIFVHRLKPCTITSHSMSVAACASYTLNSITYTTTGTYLQTLVNAGGCDSLLTINLRISNVTSSISAFNNVSCFAGNNGSATVLASGGILPYTYSWSPSGGTAATASGLTANAYNCLITDSIGCTHTQPKTITQPASPLSFTSSFTNASCTNDGTASVVASGGTSPYTYLWSNSATTTGITGLVAGPYSVVITDNKGCTTTANFTITNSILPATPNICMVTVDAGSINNVIYWDGAAYPTADSFVVYREVSTSIYARIGAVSVDSLSQFVDANRAVGPANGDPNVGSYRYKIQVRDICGNYSLLSPYHNTIYIIDAGSGQFTWSIPYAVEGGPNPVANYVLLCDTLNVDVWSPVSTVAGTQVTAIDPGFTNHASIANWRVKTLWSISCTPTRATVNTSRSNIKHANMTTAILDASDFASNDVLIYPNPANDQVTILLKPEIPASHITIQTALGQVLYEETTGATGPAGKTATLDVSSYAKGLYLISIESGKNRIFKKLILK